MSRVTAVVKYKLAEHRNEVAAKPAIILLWLPRLVLDGFLAFLLYRWLSSGSELRFAAVFAAVPVLVFALCSLIACQKLFAAREDVLLLAAPLSSAEFLLSKYAEVFISVVEFVVFLSVPVLLAVGETMSLSGGVVVALSLLLSTLLAGLLSMPGALLLVRVAVLRRRMLLRSLAALVSGLSLAMAFLAGPALLASGILARLPHGFWSHPALVLVFQIALVGAGAFFSLRYAGAACLGTRSRLAEGRRHTGPPMARKAPSTTQLTPFHGSIGAILAKDITMNARSPVQWLRAVIMLALLSLYPFIVGLIGDGTPELTMGVNVSFACLLGFVVLGEVVVNAFSVELNRIRIILAAPVPVWKIMMAKLCAYYLPTVLLCEVSVLVLDLASGLSLVGMIYSAIVTALIAVGMVALLVGMGALAAKPDRDSYGGLDEFMAGQVFFTNPSSFGVFVLGSCVVGLNAALVMMPWLLRTRGASLGGAALPLAVLLVLETNMLVSLLSLVFGSKWLAGLRR